MLLQLSDTVVTQLSAGCGCLGGQLRWLTGVWSYRDTPMGSGPVPSRRAELMQGRGVDRRESSSYLIERVAAQYILPAGSLFMGNMRTPAWRHFITVTSSMGHTNTIRHLMKNLHSS